MCACMLYICSCGTLLSAPGALSVTAHDTGHQPGIGPGDSIIIVFDIDTNQVQRPTVQQGPVQILTQHVHLCDTNMQPDINTTVGFNTLLEFNTLMPQPLAFWQNASTLIITIQSIEGVDRVATRTNHLRMYSSSYTSCFSGWLLTRCSLLTERLRRTATCVIGKSSPVKLISWSSSAVTGAPWRHPGLYRCLPWTHHATLRQDSPPRMCCS